MRDTKREIKRLTVKKCHFRLLGSRGEGFILMCPDNTAIVICNEIIASLIAETRELTVPFVPMFGGSYPSSVG